VNFFFPLHLSSTGKTKPPKTTWKNTIWKNYLQRRITCTDRSYVSIHQIKHYRASELTGCLCRSVRSYTVETWGIIDCFPPPCLSGFMNIAKLLERSLIVALACVSKGTWYLVCIAIMILWTSCIYFECQIRSACFIGHFFLLMYRGFFLFFVLFCFLIKF
jgi:hypothetical protein